MQRDPRNLVVTLVECYGLAMDAATQRALEAPLHSPSPSPWIPDRSYPGYSSYVFDRRTWYSELGFEREVFLEDLKDLPDTHTCAGAYLGICEPT